MEADCERKLRDTLDTLRDSLRGSTVIAAVSGGADSVALLALLHRSAGGYGYALRAVTVNHGIRDERESGGDAAFVAELCASLEPPVPCRVERLEPGAISRLAAERGRGIEEAARHERYAILRRRAREDGAAFVMTGHTANDQAETRLMRFIQGASGSSLAGLERIRDGSRGASAVRFVRPLLDCSHAELCAFLTESGLSWREDSTNAEDRYLRNRVRLRLVPALDRHFPGWMTGLESGAERQLLDEDLARSLVGASWERVPDGIACGAESFFAMHPAVRLRFLRDGLGLLSLDSGTSMPRRVSGGYLMELARMPAAERARKHASGLAFTVAGGRVFWRSDIVHTAKSGYLVYIREIGTYRFPFGELRISGDRARSLIDGRVGPFSLPISVRSRLAGDSVRAADGRHKKLKKLMNDWSVSERDRDRIPLVERDGEIVAVYGSPLGYPDWIVQP